MRALKEDMKNKISIEKNMSASCWFYGTCRKMAYLLSIQTIDPIFSQFSLRNNDGSQSEKEIPATGLSGNSSREDMQFEKYSTLDPGNPLTPCKRHNTFQ